MKDWNPPNIFATVIENYTKPQMFRRTRNFSAPHSTSLRCGARSRCALASLGSFNRRVCGSGLGSRSAQIFLPQASFHADVNNPQPPLLTYIKRNKRIHPKWKDIRTSSDMNKLCVIQKSNLRKIYIHS